MQRFLAVLAAAAIAAFLYTTAAPGGMQAGPTAKQFAALKKQVAALQKTVKTNQSHLNSLAVAYVHCSLHSEIEIAERGVDGLYGYSYTDGPTGFTTALDILRAGSVAPAYPLTLYNDVDPACRHLVASPSGTTPARCLHRSSLSPELRGPNPNAGKTVVCAAALPETPATRRPRQGEETFLPRGAVALRVRSLRSPGRERTSVMPRSTSP